MDTTHDTIWGFISPVFNIFRLYLFKPFGTIESETRTKNKQTTTRNRKTSKRVEETRNFSYHTQRVRECRTT
jgi:hypothetical protein